MPDFDVIELIALGLWVIVIIILGMAVVLSIVFFKKTKSKYSIGLIFLSSGFLIERIFRVLVKFYIGEPRIGFSSYEALIAVNIVLWTLVISIILLGGVSVLSNKLTGKLFVAFWIVMIGIALLIANLSVIFINSTIGNTPRMVPFTERALLYENIYLIASWFGFILLFIYVERATVDLFKVEKQKYFFTGLTIVALVVTVVENYTASVSNTLIILFIASMAGMGSIFFYMAVNSTGRIRKNSLIVCAGHFLIAFSFALDIPTGFMVFALLPSIVLLLIAPILQIVGLILYIGGLYPTIIKIKSE